MSGLAEPLNEMSEGRRRPIRTSNEHNKEPRVHIAIADNNGGHSREFVGSDGPAISDCSLNCHLLVRFSNSSMEFWFANIEGFSPLSILVSDVEFRG